MNTQASIEADGQTYETGGEVLPAYEGINAPDLGVEPKTRNIHEMSADELVERYGETALGVVKPEVPPEIRAMVDAHRNKLAQDPAERFYRRQRDRYSNPARWN